MTTTSAPPPAATREAYGPALVKLAEAGHDIVALDADLSASTGGNKLAASFPQRWFTVGAAEANLISIAAGLASTGKTVYAASFAVFMPGHCFDQIRVQIAQQRMNVKLIASHGGISVGEDGASAQAIEDLALMTSLPGMNVVVPSDAVEADAMIRSAAEDKDPWYIRLGRPKLPIVYSDGPSFTLGQADQLRDGYRRHVDRLRTDAGTVPPSRRFVGPGRHVRASAQHGNDQTARRGSHRPRRRRNRLHRLRRGTQRDWRPGLSGREDARAALPNAHGTGRHQRQVRPVGSMDSTTERVRPDL